MSRTYTHLLVHVVFSTKERFPFLSGDIGPQLHAYAGGVARRSGAKALVVGGIPDHVHLLLSLSADTSVADVVRLVKTNTSKWLRGRTPRLTEFAWQAGYSAFSVSESSREAVASYIRGQEEHHRRLSFREDLVALLERHGVAWDERYLLG